MLPTGVEDATSQPGPYAASAAEAHSDAEPSPWHARACGGTADPSLTFRARGDVAGAPLIGGIR